jgi:neutral ceramidase
VDWAEKVLALAKEGPRPRVQDFELQVLALGDMALVGMPGEVFFEYAQQVETASPFKQTMVLAYHNGCIGYVPTAAAFAEGGYEVNEAIKYYGTLMMRPESEALIVREAVALLEHTRRLAASRA